MQIFIPLFSLLCSNFSFSPLVHCAVTNCFPCLQFILYTCTHSVSLKHKAYIVLLFCLKNQVPPKWLLLSFGTKPNVLKMRAESLSHTGYIIYLPASLHITPESLILEPSICGSRFTQGMSKKKPPKNKKQNTPLI